VTGAALAAAAGGTLCVGIPGATLDAGTAATLRELVPGAIVLFARNLASVESGRSLVAALRATLAPANVLICVDQEGGRVARIPLEVPMPSAEAVGAAADPALAERVGLALAATVRSIDADVDFAPVLDVGVDPDSTVIGTRALGDDGAIVARLGAAVARGLMRGGVLAVPKHFPGHGATGSDSHVTVPVVTTDLTTLRARELRPFVAAFAAGAGGVMSAHVLVPALDHAAPATFSPRILGTLLRDELGFAGLAFTDCLEMAAVAAPGVPAAAVAALRAGADVLTISHDLDAACAARDAIVAAVAAGDVPAERLAEATSRRARAWERLVTERSAGRATPAIDPAAVAREVAARAIVTVRGTLRLDPELPATVISFEGVAADGVGGEPGGEPRPSLAFALRRRRVRAEAMRVPLDPSPAEAGAIVDVLGGQPGRTFIALARRARLHAGQTELLRCIAGLDGATLGIAVLERSDAPRLAGFGAVGTTGDDGATSIEALADRLVARP